MMDHYNKVSSDLQTKTFEVELKQQAKEAFVEAIKMFDNQIEKLDKNRPEAQPHEISE